MIYNEKRFSDIAFSKHIVTADSCSMCNKKVLHPLVPGYPRDKKNNYNEFVFGMEYKQLVKSFLSGVDYHNKILYIKDKLHSSSISYIHNKHNDSFVVVYYNTSKTLEDIIDNCNFILLDIFKNYDTDQRRKLVDAIFLHFHKSATRPLSKKQKTNIIRCIDLESYDINKSYSPINIDRRKVISKDIDLQNVQNILCKDIQHHIQSYTRYKPEMLEQCKVHIKLFLYEGFMEWIEQDHNQFPQVLCNNCKGKKLISLKFKDKLEKSLKNFYKTIDSNY